jgi:hypothetical protein
MGYGIGGHLAISQQSSFGTATANWIYMPFISESVTDNIEQLQSENLKARFDAPDNLEGINNVTGDIVFEPHPTVLGEILRGNIGQAAVASNPSSVYIHEFIPAQSDFDSNCALPPYTMAIFRNVGSQYQYTDVQFHTLAFEIVAGAIVRATATVHARTTSLQNPTTPSFTEYTPFTWNQTSVEIGGAANSVLESATITIENPIEGVPTLNGAKTEALLKRSDFRNITITGDQDFSSQTEYNRFRAQTRTAFKLSITGTEIVTGYNEQLIFDLPQVNYTTFEAPIGGPGRITAAYEGKAEYFVNSSYTMRTTLQNTLAAY